jgi:hypothetical protein
MEPMKPGLSRTDDSPYPGAYLRPVPRLNGGGGLVSTLPDMVALIRGLLPGGANLLKPETMALMMTNQLPDGMWIRFPIVGELRGRGFGLAGALISYQSLRRSTTGMRWVNSFGEDMPAHSGGFRHGQMSRA